ncbi:MAG: DUF4417 domain-containing protein [Bacilli bacterium]|nr:DUF4417 domain-containing protein [Bacilli bacterium]
MKQSESMQDFQNENTYDDDKNDKKQRIIRNEFKTVGKYNLPLIKNNYIDINKIEPWCYVKTKQNDYENRHKTIHFFTYDWLFETVYEKPEAAMEKIDQYYALMTPDFSCYLNMPLALQIYSTFKNRWCGAFWQKQGIRVIPTIEWGDKQSFEFCFDGVEQGSVVSVSTYQRDDYKTEFMLGYSRMLEVIKPSVILCYGEPFDEMRGNVKAFSPFNHKELIAKLGMAEYMKKYLAGELYPSN